MSDCDSEVQEYTTLIFHAPLNKHRNIVDIFCKVLNTTYPEADCWIDEKSELDITRINMDINVDKEKINKLAEILLESIAKISYKTTYFL